MNSCPPCSRAHGLSRTCSRAHALAHARRVDARLPVSLRRVDFHVMGFVANTLFNLVVGCRASLLASHDSKLSPALLLAAVRAACALTDTSGAGGASVGVARRRVGATAHAGPWFVRRGRRVRMRSRRPC